MAIGNSPVSLAILVIALIGGSVLVFSLIVYGAQVFNPAMSASAYTVNAITLGIGYTMWRSRNFRDGMTMLFVWYVVVTGLFFHPHAGWWNFTMEAVYLCGLACAAGLYVYVADTKLQLWHWVQRWILWTLIIGIAHGCIIILLQVISMRIKLHPYQTLNYAYLNLRSGTMVGLISGIGLQLAEYLPHKKQEEKSKESEESMSSMNII